MNLLFGIPFLILLVYITSALKNSWLVLALILVFMHFNAVAYFFFTKENKIFKSIGKSVKFTFFKIGKYFLHYVIIAIFILVVLSVTGIIFQRIFPATYIMFANLIVLIFIAAIVRNYVAEILGGADEK
jgi:cytochrome b subunit of formate dehydrogenase